MVKIIWTDSAIQDLNDIGEYIAKDSQKYAEITVEKLFTSTGILKKNPKAGRIVSELENDRIRELIRGNYRVVYYINDEFTIEVLTVHNSARLLDNTYNFSDLNED